MADDHDGEVGSGSSFRGGETAAARQADSQHVEVVGADDARERAPGFCALADADGDGSVGEQPGENLLLRAQFLIDGIGERAELGRVAGALRVELDDARSVGERPGAEPDRVHDAEDRGVHPDAECEHDRGCGGEARRFRQQAQGEPQVLRKVVDPAPAAGIARLLLNAGEIAELPRGGEARLVGREAVGRVIGGALFEMLTHFLGHLGLEGAAAE